MKNVITARLDEQADLVFEFDDDRILNIYIESIEFDKRIPVSVDMVDSEFLTDILKIHTDKMKKFN